MGVLHSMGYIRGILNCLRFTERRRLRSFAHFAKIGSNHSVTTQAKEKEKGKEKEKERERAPKYTHADATTLYLAELQVDILAVLIGVLAPIAMALLVLGRRGAAGIAAAVGVLVVAYVMQRQMAQGEGGEEPLAAWQDNPPMDG